MRVELSGALLGLALGLMAETSACFAEEAHPPGPIGTAGTAGAKAAAITRSGRLRVRVQLNVSPDLPDGTELIVFANASLADATYSNRSSTSGRTTVAAGKATLILDIYYTYAAESAAGPLTVAATVLGNEKVGAIEYLNSSSLSRSIPFPADGATTVVALSGSV
jgi:hypothetical protein